MQGGAAAVFISYNCAQREFVAKICDELAPRGVFGHLLVDFEKTLDRTSDHYEEAILVADFVLIFVSNEFKNSKTCEEEAKYVVSSKKTTLLVKIHPAAVDDYSLLDGFNFTSEIVVLTPGQTFDEAVDQVLQAIDKRFEPMTLVEAEDLAPIIKPDVTHKLRPLDITSVPKLSFKYWKLNQDDEFSEKVMALCVRKGGAMMVMGNHGVGKSTFVTHFLQTRKAFLQDICRVDFVFWLNCAKWNANAIELEASFISKINSFFDEIDLDVDLSKTTALLVLDDANNAYLLELVAANFPQMPFIAITGRTNLLDAAKPEVAENCATHWLCHLDSSSTISLIENECDLKEKLSEEQLAKIAKISCGLPFGIDVVTGRFRNCIKQSVSDLVSTEYESLAKEFNNDEEISTRKLLEFCLNQEDVIHIRAFYAFLLFQPSQPIDVEDLAVLWRCTSTHQALARCLHYARRSMVTCSTSLAGDDQVERFAVHQLWHEAAFNDALDTRRQFAPTSKDLILKIVTGHCGEVASVHKLELLSQTVLKGRWSLLETMIERLDIESLGDFCRSKNSTYTIGKTFLHFLYNANSAPTTPGKVELWARTPCYRIVERILRRLIDEPHLLNIVDILEEKDLRDSSFLIQIFDEADEADGFFDRRRIIKAVQSIQGSYDAYVKLKWLKKALLAGKKASNEFFLTSITGDYEQVKKQLEEVKPTKKKLLEANNKGETPLMAAAAIGSLALVGELYERLVAEKGDVDAVDKNGWTALMHAANYGRLEVLTFLHEIGGATLDPHDRHNGWNPFMFAVQNGHFDVVQFLFEKNNDFVMQRDNVGTTPLMLAAQSGFLEIARFLLSVNRSLLGCQDNDGWTAFLLACRFGHVDVAEFFYTVSQEVLGDSDYTGKNAVMVVSQNGHMDVAKFLLGLDGGSSLVDLQDVDGCTPLMYAAQNGHHHLVRLFCRNYPKTRTTLDWDGHDAIMHAIQQNRVSVVRLLLGDNFDSLKIENRSGLTSLMLAAKSGHLEMVKLLCERNGLEQINQSNKNGYTALMLAARCGQSEVVKFLYQMAKKPALLARDNEGTTALMHAVEKGHNDVAVFLLEKHPEGQFWRDNLGRTTLMFAAANGHLESAALLVMKQPTLLHWQADHGETALMFAAHYGHIEIAYYLVEKDAMGVEFINKDGCNAVMVAAEVGHSKVAKFLAAYQQDPLGRLIYNIVEMLESLNRGAEYRETLAFRSSLAALQILTLENQENTKKIAGLLPALSKFLMRSRTIGVGPDSEQDGLADLTTSDAKLSVLGLISNAAEVKELAGQVARLPGLSTELSSRLSEPKATPPEQQASFVTANITANLLSFSRTNLTAAELEQFKSNLTRYVEETWNNESITIKYPDRDSVRIYLPRLLGSNELLSVRLFAMWSMLLAFKTTPELLKDKSLLVLVQDVRKQALADKKGNSAFLAKIAEKILGK